MQPLQFAFSIGANLEHKMNQLSEEESRTQSSRPWPRTQKIRGQGPIFRGQTLSRPKTGMLEAKAKDQGHKRKCSPKENNPLAKFPRNFRRSQKKKDLRAKNCKFSPKF